MKLSSRSRIALSTLLSVVLFVTIGNGLAHAQSGNWWSNIQNASRNQNNTQNNQNSQTSSAPRLTSVTMTSKVFSSYTGSVFVGDQVTLSFTSSAALQKPVVTINGRAASVSGSSNNRTWTAKSFMGRNDPAGPVSFVINAKTTAGVALAPVTTLTSGSKPSFAPTLSPTYCLYSRQYTSSPLTYTGSYTRSYTLDANCPPQATIATFSAQVGTTPAYTATARTKNTLTIKKDCGFLGFSCDKEMRVKYGTTKSTSGTLPPFVLPNQEVTLSWACQPFQVMLWKKDDYNWWGLNDQDSVAASLFTYSTTPTGTGFSTGGKLSGSVKVNPTNTTTYKINCGSQNYQFPDIQILVDNPQGTVTASPVSVRPGGTAQVFWSATNVKDNSCKVTDSAGRVVVGTENKNAGPGGGVRSGALTAAMSPATFTLTCERYSGEMVSWVSNPITVATTCQPTYNSRQPNDCSFNTTASTLEGGAVTARWYCPAGNQSYRIESSTNNGSTWQPVTTGTVPSNNNRERAYQIDSGDGPIVDTTYRLTCVSTNGNSVGSDTTTVAHPSLSISANPPTLTLLGGALSRLSWSAQNVNSNSCRVTAQGSTSVLGSGNTSNGRVQVTPTVLPSSYVLTCRTPASAENRTPHPSRVLTIYETGMEPTLEIDLSPLQVRREGSTTLTWEGVNLPGSCTLTTSPSIPTLEPIVNSNPDGSSAGITIGPILQNTNVTLTCGTASDTENVGIVPEFKEI